MSIERKKYSEDETAIEKDNQKPDNYFFSQEDNDQYATGKLSLDEGEEVFLDEEVEDEEDLEMKINGQLDQIYDLMKYGQLNGSEMLNELDRLTVDISYNQLWNILEAYDNNKRLTDKLFENFLGAWARKKTRMVFEKKAEQPLLTPKEKTELKEQRFGDFLKEIVDYNQKRNQLDLVRESIQKASIKKPAVEIEAEPVEEIKPLISPIAPNEVKNFGNGGKKIFHRFE